MTKSRGSPCLISPSAEFHLLERIVLGSGNFNESWLQKLIHDRPEILPINQIEPGFGSPIALAREVRCGHGIVDNLYLTPTGEIILVEAKLWSNPQARREVVAQALDYVAALMSLTYEEFETAIINAESSAKSLYARIEDQPDALSQSEFIDAVSNNLARGRILVLIVGDGIRREAEALGALLQSHAGAHFTFALIQLAAWRNPVSGDILIIPDVLAQTVMIERGVVRLENGILSVQGAEVRAAKVNPKSISEEMFYEELAKLNPTLPSSIRAFLASVEPMGVYADLKASLNLKIDSTDSSSSINLGYIQKNGTLWTSPLSASVPHDIAMRYNQTLSSAIGGTVAIGSSGSYASTNGKSGPPISTLLPERAETWADAIKEVIDDMHTLSKSNLAH